MDRPDDARVSRVLHWSDRPRDQIHARSLERSSSRGATSFVALCWIPWSVAHWPPHLSGETISCVAILSVVCTAGAFLTFFELVKEVGATRGVVVTYVNTAVAVVLGVVGLHEPLTIGIILGFPLVLVGSIFATSSAASTRGLGRVGGGDTHFVVNE